MLQSYSLPAAIYRTLLALAGWATLVLQFALARADGNVAGQPMWLNISNFFSYFTILTNLLMACSLTAAQINPRSATGAFFSRSTVQTAIAGYMLVVGCIYNVVLAKLWNPQGVHWLADFSLHTLLPILYLVYWVLFVPKGALWLSAPIAWLLYPLAYLLYSLARGAIMDWYPYPFLDAGELGYAFVTRNSIILLGVFLVFFYLLILSDRAMGRRMARSAA
jgi:hypothetical protein